MEKLDRGRSDPSVFTSRLSPGYSAELAVGIGSTRGTFFLPPPVSKYPPVISSEHDVILFKKKRRRCYGTDDNARV